MLNSPRFLSPIILGVVLSSGTFDVPVFGHFQTGHHPAMATVLSPPSSVTEKSVTEQSEEGYDNTVSSGELWLAQEPRWGNPGGSRGPEASSPELNWGEPGGSRVVADMADDLVDFYQWGDPGGSRGLLCPITPHSPQVEFAHEGPFDIWSDRPLIVWHSGDVRRVVIRDYDTNAIVWNRAVDSTDTQVRYDGDPLEPSKQYVLIFAGPSPEEFLFGTLPEAQKNAISDELAQLEREARANGASDEQVALWRSRFFVQHEYRLLYDGLDAIFAIENPSPELVESQTELVSSLCNLNVNE
ncbi:MAG: hypothetical protein F6K09_08665 [Merismopedia sp. SIO2A8]|nr:hypothetical protein [Merismopedia sp. SIO2A8]